MTDPVCKSVTVPLDRFAAFELFTAGMDRWWPKDSHSLSARDGNGAQASVRVEPGAGGLVIETRADGSEAPWGTVTAWEPGLRFAVDWYVGRDPSQATRVEVTFTEIGAGTRVDLVHSGFEVLGGEADTIGEGYRSGWDLVLVARYGGAAGA